MSVVSLIVRGLGFIFLTPFFSIALQFIVAFIGIPVDKQIINPVCNLCCYIISYFLFINPPWESAKKKKKPDITDPSLVFQKTDESEIVIKPKKSILKIIITVIIMIVAALALIGTVKYLNLISTNINSARDAYKIGNYRAVLVKQLQTKDKSYKFGPYLKEFNLLADISLEKYYQEQVDKYNNGESVVEGFNFIQNNYGYFKSTQYYCNYYKSASNISVPHSVTENQSLKIQSFLKAYPENKNAIDLINKDTKNLWSFLIGKWKSSEGKYYFNYSRDEDGGHVDYGLPGKIPYTCFFDIKDGVLYYYTEKEEKATQSSYKIEQSAVTKDTWKNLFNSIPSYYHELVTISIIDENSFVATANNIKIIMNRQLSN